MIYDQSEDCIDEKTTVSISKNKFEHESKCVKDKTAGRTGKVDCEVSSRREYLQLDVITLFLQSFGRTAEESL